MANRAAKERNSVSRGRTGMLNTTQRKKRNMKAKPHGKGKIPPGTPLPKEAK